MKKKDAIDFLISKGYEYTAKNLLGSFSDEEDVPLCHLDFLLINDDEVLDSVLKEDEISIIVKPEKMNAGQIIIDQETSKNNIMDKNQTFPMDKNGNINYSEITEPQVYKLALEEEFGTEAGSVLNDLIKAQIFNIEDANKEVSAIERIRKVKSINVEVEKLNEVKLLFPIDKEFPTDTLNSKENQSHSEKKIIDETMAQPNLTFKSKLNKFTKNTKHKILIGFGIVILILIFTNPSKERFTEFLKAEGKELSAKSKYSKAPTWGRDKNYLLFSTFKYNYGEGGRVTYFAVLNNFYLILD